MDRRRHGQVKETLANLAAPLRIGYVGSDPVLAQRLGVLESADVECWRMDDDAEGGLLFVGVPTAERFGVAAAALRKGSNVCLEWPPALTIRECARLVRLSEEAGLETAVSRPLRSALPDLERATHARLVSIEIRGATQLAAALAEAIDISFALVGSASVRRVDAGVERDNRRNVRAAVVGIRFHSGAMAQALIRADGSTPRFRIYATGAGRDIECNLVVDKGAIGRETLAIVRAVAEGSPVPVSILDALQTMRTVERVMGMLR